MVALEFFESLSLIEMAIFGFIGVNLTFASTFAAQRGLKHVLAERSE